MWQASEGWLPAGRARTRTRVCVWCVWHVCSLGVLLEPWLPQSPDVHIWFLLTFATLPSPTPAYSTLPCGSCRGAPDVYLFGVEGGHLPGWVPKIAQAQLFSVMSADPQQMADEQAAPWPTPSTSPFCFTSLLLSSDGPGARTSLAHQRMLPGGRYLPHLLAGTFLLP